MHPKMVPQMADAEDVCRSLPQRGDVRYTGLVLNERGYDRLLATERLDEAGLVVPASDTFGERNQGMTVAEGVTMARGILSRGRRNGFPVQVTIAVAFGCPFEGDVRLGIVVDMAKAIAEAEPVEIALADTVGVGVPGQVCDTFSAVRECPFAPNATGNIATEDLVYMLNRSRVEHEVNIQELLDGAAWLETRLGKPVPSALLKAGAFSGEPTSSTG